MSIDLDWANLDPALSTTLVDILNRQLATTQRPSFIGPVEVTSLDFGATPPDVELVDLRDIYRDFLEDDDDSDAEDDGDPVKHTEGAEGDDDDGFEWVSRKAAGRAEREHEARVPPGPAYHHLPPHVRYGYGQGTADMFASTPALRSARDVWNGGMGMSLPGLADFRPAYAPALHRSFLAPTPFSTPVDPFFSNARTPPDPESDVDSSPPPEETDSPSDPPAPQAHPNLQLHLFVTWPADLRLTLTTSLLINYPSPNFMSLPIKLSVTGLLFTGELAVAYEGARRRVHLCILDDLDPYGPASRRPDADEDVGGKPAPVGQRLLPSICIESEIGQADKHVLKNVTRVERFIQDVIRKTVEEELVFPNFHTLMLGER